MTVVPPERSIVEPASTNRPPKGAKVHPAGPSNVIYLESDETIGSIREKLELTDGPQVVLVAPRYVKELRNPVRLKLLGRQARYLAKDLILVAEDANVRRLAKQEGIRVAGSLRGIDRRLAAVAKERDAANRRGPIAFGRPGFGLLVGIAAAFAIVVFGLVVASIFVPSATVEVAIIGNTASETLTIKASRTTRAVNFEGRTIPARQLQAEAGTTDETTTSGKRTSVDERAKGRVKLTNKTGDRQAVRVGTVVRTAGDIRFTTDSEVSVPPNGSVDAAVTAVEQGTTGNVARATIISFTDSDLNTKLSVTNDTPTAGGSQKDSTFVTAADRARLRAQVLEKLKTEGYARLYEVKRESESLYRDTVSATILDEIFDHLLDEESKTLGINVKARVTAIAFDSKDVTEIGSRYARAQLKPGEQVLPGSLETAPLGVAGADDDSITFNLQVRYQVVPAVDQDLVRTAIAGRAIDEAATYLANSYNLARPPDILVWPRFLTVLPRLANRIELRVVGG